MAGRSLHSTNRCGASSQSFRPRPLIGPARRRSPLLGGPAARSSALRGVVGSYESDGKGYLRRNAEGGRTAPPRGPFRADPAEASLSSVRSPGRGNAATRGPVVAPIEWEACASGVMLAGEPAPCWSTAGGVAMQEGGSLGAGDGGTAPDSWQGPRANGGRHHERYRSRRFGSWTT